MTTAPGSLTDGVPPRRRRPTLAARYEHRRRRATDGQRVEASRSRQAAQAAAPTSEPTVVPGAGRRSPRPATVASQRATRCTHGSSARPPAGRRGRPPKSPDDMHSTTSPGCTRARTSTSRSQSSSERDGRDARARRASSTSASRSSTSSCGQAVAVKDRRHDRQVGVGARRSRSRPRTRCARPSANAARRPPPAAGQGTAAGRRRGSGRPPWGGGRSRRPRRHRRPRRRTSRRRRTPGKVAAAVATVSGERPARRAQATGSHEVVEVVAADQRYGDREEAAPASSTRRGGDRRRPGIRGNAGRSRRSVPYQRVPTSGSDVPVHPDRHGLATTRPVGDTRATPARKAARMASRSG